MSAEDRADALGALLRAQALAQMQARLERTAPPTALLDISPNNCAVCQEATEPGDRLPFRSGVAHFACVARAELSRTRRGRVLVLAGRRGPAFGEPTNDRRKRP